MSTPNLMMRYGLRMNRRHARAGLAVLGVVGTGIGVLCSLVGGPIGRIAGLPEDSRTRWALQLFGVRELLLGLGLFHASRRDDAREARLFAGLLALAQLGDLAVTTATLRGGGWRLRIAVWVTAPPTMVLAEVIRRSYAE